MPPFRRVPSLNVSSFHFEQLLGASELASRPTLTSNPPVLGVRCEHDLCCGCGCDRGWGYDSQRDSGEVDRACGLGTSRPIRKKAGLHPSVYTEHSTSAKTYDHHIASTLGEHTNNLGRH